MTAKPAWCPQEVWDEAMDLYDPAAWHIAKAILKAKNDAYEEAAWVAGEYAEENKAMAVDALDINRPLDMVAATKASVVSDHISQAIRNLKHETEV